MQNSAIVAARGLIMLSCLVAVPVVAVVWNDFPADWQTLRSRAIELLDRPWRKAEPTFSADEAPAAAPPAAISQAPPAAAFAAAPATQLPSVPPTTVTPLPVRQSPLSTAPRPSAAPVRRSMSAWSREMASERRLATPSPRSEAPQSRFQPAGPLVPIPSVAPAQRGAGDVSPATHMQSRAGAPGAMPDHSAAANPTIENQLARLRQLGASYYLLETWGGDGRLFRFHSKMSTGPGRATRHFEATDSEPLSAIRQVVRQVEAWRFSNSP